MEIEIFLTSRKQAHFTVSGQSGPDFTSPQGFRREPWERGRPARIGGEAPENENAGGTPAFPGAFARDVLSGNLYGGHA